MSDIRKWNINIKDGKTYNLIISIYCSCKNQTTVSSELTFTDRASDSDTAPLNPDHVSTMDSFQSKPQPKWQSNGYRTPTTTQRESWTYKYNRKRYPHKFPEKNIKSHECSLTPIYAKKKATAGMVSGISDPVEIDNVHVIFSKVKIIMMASRGKPLIYRLRTE